MIALDVETLDIRSSAVILSVAVVRFDLSDAEEKFRGQSPNDVYREYLDSALFVKFDVKEQFNVRRTVDDGTVDWWKQQGQLAREKSFIIDKTRDVDTKTGIQQITDYCYTGDREPVMWQRGGMDQIVWEDLSKQFGMKILPFWNWMDVRTAINITKDTASKGYCSIPDFDRQLVVKHDPVHDVAYDVMMLVYGK